MDELELFIPTYNGSRFPDEVHAGTIEEYGDPHVPIKAYREAGLRVVLGTHDPEADHDRPDLLIERQPNAWAVFIHPDGGDPSAYLYILDDGRSYLVPETGPGPTPAIRVVDEPDDVPGLRAPATIESFTNPPPTHHPRSVRLLPRKLRDLGILGSAIRDALAEIHRITAAERLDPSSMERVIDKHLTRLSRPMCR